MSTGVKVAIGCAVVVVVLGIGALAAVFGAAWWVRGKAKEFTGEQERITTLQEKANRNPFTPPAEGVIAEDRLLKFLDVRRRVYSIYVKHKDEIEERAAKKQGELGDVTAAFGLVNEIRLAKAEAQVQAGMSDAEYLFLVEQVYRSAWASEMSKELGGRSMGEAIGQALEQAESGSPDGSLPPEARKAMEEMRRAFDQAAQSPPLQVPPANIELFRRHEAEIKKYAMSGLDWLGL